MDSSTDRHAERREQSINRLQRAAVELLARKSYGDIRIQDITSAAGMAKGSLYMYFDGKDDLYVQAIDELFIREFSGAIGKIMDRDDPREALRELVDFAVEVTPETENIKVVYRAFTDPPLMELLREKMDSYMEQYLSLLRENLGRLGSCDPSSDAYLLAVLLDGIWIYRIVDMQPLLEFAGHGNRLRIRNRIYRMFGLENISAE